jgi:hypothetical protein
MANMKDFRMKKGATLPDNSLLKNHFKVKIIFCRFL